MSTLLYVKFWINKFLHFLEDFDLIIIYKSICFVEIVLCRVLYVFSKSLTQVRYTLLEGRTQILEAYSCPPFGGGDSIVL